MSVSSIEQLISGQPAEVQKLARSFYELGNRVPRKEDKIYNLAFQRLTEGLLTNEPVSYVEKLARLAVKVSNADHFDKFLLDSAKTLGYLVKLEQEYRLREEPATKATGIILGAYILGQGATLEEVLEANLEAERAERAKYN
jgi:hypothetical protein